MRWPTMIVLSANRQPPPRATAPVGAGWCRDASRQSTRQAFDSVFPMVPPVSEIPSDLACADGVFGLVRLSPVRVPALVMGRCNGGAGARAPDGTSEMGET
ncbi:hypothetical protein GCM10023088_57030 [Actinomadura verrucosospora]